jgi:hypothetical protein
MSGLKRKLDLVFYETSNGGHVGRRYIAKSLDGGTGWGVYDRREGRFLKDREVSALDEEMLRQPEKPS